ncbi:hypothetical protein ABPG74_005284 [Tetrahymena malaccensis]
MKKINFCNLNKQEIENLLKGRKENIQLIKTLKVYDDRVIFLGLNYKETVEPGVLFIQKQYSLEVKSLFQKQQREREFENLNLDQQDIFKLKDSFLVPLPSQIEFFLQVNQYSLNLNFGNDDQIKLIELIEKNFKKLEEKQKYIQNQLQNDSSISQEKDIQQFQIYPEKLINALNEQNQQFNSFLLQKSIQIMSSSNYYKMTEFTNRFLYKIFETNKIQDQDPYIVNKLLSQKLVNDRINQVFFEDNILYLFIIDQKGFESYNLIEQFNVKLLKFIKTIFINVEALNISQESEQIFEQLQALTYLEINLRSKISNFDLLSLKNGLLQMKNLQTLLFDVSHNKLNNDSLTQTVEALSELKNLKNLYFLINNTQVNKEGICQIAELLQKINQLEILIIDVKQCRIGIDGPKALANCCKKLTKIQLFEVYFTSAFERSIFELELSLQDNNYRVCGAIQYQAVFIQSLQDIDIRLQSNYLDIDEIQVLFNYLSVIPQQKSLKLDLCSTQINDSGVNLLQNFLSQMNELEKLILNLSYNQISIEGTFKFGKFFRQVQNLKKLDFIYQEPVKRLFFEISYFYEENFGPKQRSLLFPKYLSIDEQSKIIEIDLSDSLFLSMNERTVKSMMNLLSQQSKIQGLIFSSLDREKHTLLFQILSQLKSLKHIKYLKIQKYAGVSQYFLPEQNLRKRIHYQAFKMPRLVMLKVQA